MSFFDDITSFIDPFSAQDWEEIFLVGVAVLAGYIFLEKGIDKLI